MKTVCIFESTAQLNESDYDLFLKQIERQIQSGVVLLPPHIRTVAVIGEDTNDTPTVKLITHDGGR